MILSPKYSTTLFIISCAILIACGDDSSSANNVEDNLPSSSSISQQDDVKVSSAANQSSSSFVASSSQQAVEESSSSQELSSSSSDMPEESSSSLFVPPADSAWTYLNPEISYGELIDERDGQVYKTVIVGGREWMAQNLNYADSVNTPSLLGKSWCYNNDPAMCYRYGRLYTWAAAIDSVTLAANGKICGMDRDYNDCIFPQGVQGVCPGGWHVPTAKELNNAFYAGATHIISWGGTETYENSGKNLKSISGWDNDKNGIDSLGLSILPAGYRNPSYESSSHPSFEKAGSATALWASSVAQKTAAWQVLINEDREDFLLIDGAKDRGLSVRCVKDTIQTEQE